MSVDVSTGFILMATAKQADAPPLDMSGATVLALSDRNINTDINVSGVTVLIAKKSRGKGVPRQRAWTFDFDGHTFYVLDLYDLIVTGKQIGRAHV